MISLAEKGRYLKRESFKRPRKATTGLVLILYGVYGGFIYFADETAVPVLWFLCFSGWFMILTALSGFARRTNPGWWTWAPSYRKAIMFNVGVFYFALLLSTVLNLLVASGEIPWFMETQ